MELVAISATDARLDDSTGSLVGALYCVPMVLLGVGPAGGRDSVPCGPACSTGPRRWLLLALGVYVFVVMFPAVFGPMVGGPHRDRRVAAGLRLARALAHRAHAASAPASSSGSVDRSSPSMTTTP